MISCFRRCSSFVHMDFIFNDSLNSQTTQPLLLRFITPYQLVLFRHFSFDIFLSLNSMILFTRLPYVESFSSSLYRKIISPLLFPACPLVACSNILCCYGNFPIFFHCFLFSHFLFARSPSSISISFLELII